MLQQLIEQLRQELPSVFAGTSVAELTGGAINWGTIQNKRSRREIPDQCFVRSGTRVLVLRDPFLDWWGATLSEARQPTVSRPRHQKADAGRDR
jgi:hypothetical protein